MISLKLEFTDEENMFSEKEIDNLKNALFVAVNNVIKPKFNISVNVTAVDADEIQKLNCETRNVDKITDVLSFPMLEFSSPEVFLDEPQPWDFDPEDNSLFMGDIILCKEKIESQAVEYGHSFLRESVYLTLHGLLHLFGYDHMIDEDKAIMRAKEKEILKIIKI